MNDIPDMERWEAERLQRMLEGVTAADRADPVPRDEPEAAGLRDAWLAFGRLLDAAEEAQSGNWHPKSVLQSEPPKKQPAKRGRYVAAFAAAAAALCVALGLGWWLSRGGQPNGNGGQAIVKKDSKTDQPQAAPTQQNQPQPIAPTMPVPSIASNETNKPKKSADHSAWDDPIATQITEVSQQIDSVRQTWQHRTDDVDLVQYRIDEVSAGLSKDAL